MVATLVTMIILSPRPDGHLHPHRPDHADGDQELHPPVGPSTSSSSSGTWARWTASSRRCWTARRWSKVFCHEEQAKADFRKVNEALRQSANLANRYSNLLMPINANIGC